MEWKLTQIFKIFKLKNLISNLFRISFFCYKISIWANMFLQLKILKKEKKLQGDIFIKFVWKKMLTFELKF